MRVTYLQERILRLLTRHVRDEDANLSDSKFVEKLFERYKKYLHEEIVDVNE